MDEKNFNKNGRNPELITDAEIEDSGEEVIAAELVDDGDSLSPDFAEVLPDLVEDKEELSSSTDLIRFDPLGRYLAEIRHLQPLSKEEEHSLAIAYREHGDQAAGYKLVMSNLRLVVLIAREYQRTVRNLLDLVQEGNIGLLEAVKQYDPYRGIRFPSYAVYWIRAYMLRYLINNIRLVKIGTTQAQRKLFFNLNKEKEKLEAEGFIPEAKLLAERLNVKESEVIEMEQRLGLPDVSVDAPINANEDGGDLLGVLSDDSADVEELVANEQIAQKLRTSVEELKDSMDAKEKAIVDQRLFCDEPVSLQVIADQFGLSRERIRQIENRLKNKLKKHISKLLDLNEQGEVEISSDVENNAEKGISSIWLVVILGVIAAIGFLVYQGYGLYRFVFENEAPQIKIISAPTAVGQETAKVVIEISDGIAGLDELKIRRESRTATKDLVHRRYWMDNQYKDTVELELNGKDPDNKEGRIALSIKVFDRAFWSNKAEERLEIPIDMVKPKVSPISAQHNGAQGGTQLSIYRASDKNLSESGVVIGDQYYRGYDLKNFEPEFVNLSEMHLIFYPIPYDLNPSQNVRLYAHDIGGNISYADFYNKVRAVKRPSRYSDITAQQLNKATNSLWPSCKKLVTDSVTLEISKPLDEAYPSPDDRFSFINKECRAATKTFLQKLARQSAPKRYFDAQWIRPTSTQLMGFAEGREWRRDGVSLSAYINEGVEFSVSGRGDISPINAGKVIYAGELGMLGKTVVVDHGFGLVSVYGNLSEILIEPGAVLNGSSSLGRIYEANALALTPRVHIELYASGLAINPSEWWDNTWRRDHIEEKLAGIKRQYLGIVSAGDQQGAEKLAPSE